MTKAKLSLKNGKFYCEGKEVAPKFGNPDQIKLLKQIQLKANLWSKAIPVKFVDYVDSFDKDSEDGIEPGVQLVGKCKCGGEILSDVYEKETAYEFTDGDDMTCLNNKCREEYIVIYREDIEQARAIKFDTYSEAKNN